MFASEPLQKVFKEEEPKKTKKPFIEVTIGGRYVFIRKSTAVWLFQEGERVSSDRLFQVRAKQPYSLNISEVKCQ